MTLSFEVYFCHITKVLINVTPAAAAAAAAVDVLAEITVPAK